MVEPRARLVAFRLSREQYEYLHNASRHAGARSLSEFARSAILAQIASEETPQGLLLHDLGTLSRRLKALDLKLGDLRLIIQSLLGSEEPASARVEEALGSEEAFLANGDRRAKSIPRAIEEKPDVES